MRFSKKSDGRFNRNFWQSVDAALEGIIHTLQTERNMRLHFIIGFFALVAGLYFNLDYVEFILLLFAISFVLVSEMVNTALESLSDVVSKKEYDPVIKIAKDVSAGAVFVAAVNAGLTGYILTATRINIHRGDWFFRIRRSPWHITLIALIASVWIVIMVKLVRGEKNLLKGGMPSGHSAVAFAIWMAVWLLSKNTLISILVFLVALIVAKSRLQNGIHSAWEVLVGGVLGALTSLLVFQVLL